MSYDKVSPEAEAGRRGEQVVFRFFKERGYGVFNVNGGSIAPTLARATDDGNIIMPDIQVFVPGEGMEFVEVKWKEGPVLWQITGKFRHGIDLPNWQHYGRIQDAYNIKISLAIVQLKECRDPRAPIEPKLLFQSVDVLSQNLAKPYPAPPNASFPAGAAYWDAEVFVNLGPIDGLEFQHIPRTQLNPRPWERLARDGTPPQQRRRPPKDEPPLLRIIGAKKR